VHAGIHFLVLFRGGADDRAPLIVGMHGRGGSPERFSRVLQDFSGRAEIALAQAPTKSGEGWAWFPGSHTLEEPEFVAAFDAAEKQLWQAITDFSQGGMLSYVLAARHPRDIAYAFPISGCAPPAFLPRGQALTAPVYALHGTSDQMIEIDLARSAVAAFKEQGGTAELREFAGVGHDMPPPLREDLLAHIRAAVDAESARAAPADSAARQGRAGSGAGVRGGNAASESLR
jgi:phospholipase/carboxylesterase